MIVCFTFLPLLHNSFQNFIYISKLIILLRCVHFFSNHVCFFGNIRDGQMKMSLNHGHHDMKNQGVPVEMALSKQIFHMLRENRGCQKWILFHIAYKEVFRQVVFFVLDEIFLYNFQTQYL
ncbi:hypothetical protein ACJX0J_039942, partial [Zea mays]